MTVRDAIAGCILGTAVGDAIGLPREGLSRRRAQRMFGSRPLEHRFLFGRGMVSDDTEHSCFVASALLRSQGRPEAFGSSLAWRLRWWLVGLPAGVGMATLRGILRLWVGFPPSRSGVYSAGNGPAMRAGLLGLCAGDDTDLLKQLVRASTRITHTDPKAEEGALAVALATAYVRQHQSVDPVAFVEELKNHVKGDELIGAIDLIVPHLDRQADAGEYAEALQLGDGVTGYINHTVPVVLYCWLRYGGDFRQAVEEVVGLGGDADTTGAILGGLLGATLGPSAIPDSWLDGLIEWPMSVEWMRRLGTELASRIEGGPEAGDPRNVRLFWPGMIPRNLAFLMIVLTHGLRRLFPPY